MIILSIVSVMSVIGYVVYSRYQNEKNKCNCAVNPFTKEDSSKNQKYFEISEWKVKAPYSGSYGLGYSLDSSGTIATFTAQNYTEKYTQSYKECPVYDAGQIQRFVAEDYVNQNGAGQTIAQVAKEKPNDYVKLNEYYYRFTYAQKICKSLVSNLQSSANNETKSIVERLTPIPSKL